MKLFEEQSNPECIRVRGLLSEYTDDILSARNAWDVEKHLTGCASCANAAREMQATIELLRSAERYDTSLRFMGALHARLDMVDPSIAPGPPLWQRLRGWFAGVDRPFQGSRIPALSLGLAGVAFVLFVATNHPGDPKSGIPTLSASSDSVQIAVATSASSPFSDPAADNLELRSGSRGGSSNVPF